MIQLSDEQRRIQEVARSFADEVLAPVADELDRDEAFPEEGLARAAEKGFAGVYIPPKYGGQGWGEMENVLIMEEFNRVCPSTGVTLSVHNSLVLGPMLRFGSELQHEKYFPDMARADILGAYALSEPGHGSNPAGMECSYADAGDHYVLNGTKCWITNGSHADLFIVFATKDRSMRTKGISAFLVERDFPGFSIGRKEEKLGIRGSSTTTILLEECRVPKENLLGDEGRGFAIAMNTLDHGRVGIATQALGIAQGLLDAAFDHAMSTSRNGSPLIEDQGIAFTIADMRTEIDAARLMIRRTAALQDRGEAATLEASMSKLFASETANRCGRRAVEIAGGPGAVRGSTIERLFRDAKITEIYEGTSEIQRLVISRNLTKAARAGD